MKRIAPFAFLAMMVFGLLDGAGAEPVEAPAGTYKLDPTHASLTWRVKHMGLAFYTARFTKFDATLDIDPAKAEAARLSVTVDPLSVRTDYPLAAKKDFDKELAEGSKWFDGNAHKSITFQSTSVARTGDSTAKVAGNLTLRGVTKPVTLDVTLNGAMKLHPLRKKPALGFSATATIKRSEFGMTALLGPALADEVQLVIEAEMLGN